MKFESFKRLNYRINRVTMVVYALTIIAGWITKTPKYLEIVQLLASIAVIVTELVDIACMVVERRIKQNEEKF